MTGATARLAAVLGCVALATSRLGLVLHELGGHGGVALALGGTITEVKLFWFAGGWIRYSVDTGTAGLLAITCGGMAIETLVGVSLWLGARGRALGARLVRGAGGGVLVHASWYFATGTWHGYGDGTLLYRELGDARWPAAIAGALLGCTAAFATARWLFGAVVATVARRRQLALALACAVGLNAGLFLGERLVRTDVVYAQAMQREDQRVVTRELVRWQVEQHQAGVQVDEAQLAAKQQALEDENRQFPFRWIYAIALFGAILAGAHRSTRQDRAVIAGRLVVAAAGIATAATALVIALSLVL
jgi:hypothetical protein